MNNIQISRKFRLSIYKVIFTIVLFFISYLILLAIATILLFGSGFAAMQIMSVRIGIFTLAASAGLVSLGIMFFIFLIKFIFIKHIDENPYRKEIFNHEHPELFKMIEETAIEVGTKKPKKVYITHDVNASVFYNSSFWSLFFPVRKNLQIGLGLVNCVDSIELKAVLAHEFGHFSQKSMKLGTYVYTVNNAIYNMVYQNDSWDKVLNSWASAGGVFGIFALITSKLADMVRFLLRKSYSIVNIPYMTLSREMEFHADSIAANTVGKDQMISALRRIEFGDLAFNQTFRTLETLSNNHIHSENIYQNHKHDIHLLSTHFNLKTENGLPLISKKDLDLNTFKPRVNFIDHWASHPSRDEREENILKTTNVTTSSISKDSWVFFNSPHSIQIEITKLVYALNAPESDSSNTISNSDYISHLESEQSKYAINEFFKGYYNNRFLFNVNIDELDQLSEIPKNLEEISLFYNSEIKTKYDQLISNENDLLTLKQIKSKEIKAKYFEFDDKKYKRKEVEQPIRILEEEIDTLRNELVEKDKNAISLNIAIAKSISIEEMEALIRKYNIIFETQKIIDKHTEFTNNLDAFHYTVFNKPKWQEDELKQFNRDIFDFKDAYKDFIKNYKEDLISLSTKKHNTDLQAFIQEEKHFLRVLSFDADGFNQFYVFVMENQQIFNNILISNLTKLTDSQLENYKRINTNQMIEIA